MDLLAGLGHVVADKIVSLHITNHFISKVVHDKFPFVREVVANGPRLRIGCLPNLLLRMHGNGHNCTSALNIECKKLSSLSLVSYRI